MSQCHDIEHAPRSILCHPMSKSHIVTSVSILFKDGYTSVVQVKIFAKPNLKCISLPFESTLTLSTSFFFKFFFVLVNLCTGNTNNNQTCWKHALGIKEVYSWFKTSPVNSFYPFFFLFPPLLSIARVKRDGKIPLFKTTRASWIPSIYLITCNSCVS